jgi:hypothetical protein
MKTKMTLIFLSVFMVILNLNAQQQPADILGTWKLISYRYGERDIQFPNDSVLRSIKLITPTHFTWVHYTTKDQLVRASAGGTYVLDGNNYTERIDFGGSSMQSFFNKEQAYKIKIADGKLYLSGVMSDDQKIEEIWEKIEPK